MWEFTAIEGLNVAQRGAARCTFYSEDLVTGAVCRAYGFDVGQPLACPPMHPDHKDLGLGKVERILSFPSLHELSFAFVFSGHRFVAHWDGRQDELVLTLHASSWPRHLRHALVYGDLEVELRPGQRYAVGEGVHIIPSSGAPVPQADLSEAEAMRQCVFGNTVRAPSGELYVPVNRAWVTMMGRMFGYGEGFRGPLTFIWDAAFASVLAARVDLEIARSNLRLLLMQLDASGWLRQLRVGDKTNNLAGLPVVTLAAMSIFEASQDPADLAELFPKLLANNRWLRAHRDKNGDGLLEWGFEAQGQGIELQGRWAPGYESGLDDSPMWQNEPVDLERRAMATSAVCLNSLYAYDCLLLARMARILGRHEEQAALETEVGRMRRLIDARLWDESRALYANRRWSGDFSTEVSPTSFFPLLVCRGEASRVRALLSHLDNESTFGGELRLPSIARSSPHFSAHGDYWRGRIWPPLNYLATLAVHQVDEDIAAELAQASQRLFLREWRAHGHVHENYCADSGWGEGPAGVYYRSCPFYTWGGLLLLGGHELA